LNHVDLLFYFIVHWREESIYQLCILGENKPFPFVEFE